MIPSIAIVNDPGSGISESQLGPMAAALTKQLFMHLSEPPPVGWSATATVRLASPNRPPRVDEWLMLLLEHPDQPGEYGRHDQTPNGRPLMKCFPRLDLADGHQPSITISHEIIETLIDPMLARGAQARDGRWWAVEACDAVERDSYAIDGVLVSNFVLPSYFEPPPQPDGALDFMRLITKPLEIRPGGYNQVWDGSGWQMLEGPGGMRSARRALMGRRRRRASANATLEVFP